MRRSRSILAVSLMLSLAATACSTSQNASGEAAKSKDEIRAEKIKAKEEAEAKKYPQPPADSPLAKVKAGMSDTEVRQILGAPTSTKSYQNGKQWIPGYGAFAPDIARTEYTYHGLGLVTLNQNKYSGALTVYRVVYDPSR